MTTDLTVGKPSQKLFWFSIPLLLSVAFQQLYQMADSIIVGRFAATAEAGALALAAVGASYPITQLFVAVATGINSGTGVLVSQLFGAKRYLRMKTAISTALLTTTAVALLLTLIGAVGTNGIMNALSTPENIFADGSLYLRVYVFGLLFLFVYNVCTGIFNAMGDSRTPLILLVLSSVGNVILDLVFVAGLQWGVAGVAWATFICQGVSCILAVFFVFRRFAKIETDGKPAAFSFALLKRIAAVAIPSILQQSFISVGNIIIQGVINSFGSGVIAGYSASIKLNNLVITSFTTFGNGISNYTAQNLGARKFGRIKEGFKAGVKLTWMICIPIVAVYLLASRYLIYFFLESPTGMAMDTGMLFLRILTPFYFFAAAKLVSDGVLRGAGQMKAFMTGTFTDLILRVVLAIILSKTALASTGIWVSWPVGWCVAGVISLTFCFKYMNMVKYDGIV